MSMASAVSNANSSVSFHSRHRHAGKKGRSRLVGRADLYQNAIDSEESYLTGGQYSSIEIKTIGARAVDIQFRKNCGLREVDDDILPEHAADAVSIIAKCYLSSFYAHYTHIFSVFKLDPGQDQIFGEDKDNEETAICGGKRALCSFGTITRSYNALVKIANPDNETKRLLALGTPLTIAAVVESLCEAVAVALISNYLGVMALTAYIVTNLLIGLSDVFINGVSSALNTVCSHAIGADNYYLAGQYVQIALVIYCLLSIPIMGVWWFVMGDCLRLFGLNEEIVNMGVQYTKVVIFDYIVTGIFDSYTALLDISGYAVPATAFDVIAGGADLLVVWCILAYVPGISLFWVGVAHLTSGIICFVLFTSIAVCKGWLDPFWNGLVKNFALKVSQSFIEVVKVLTSSILCAHLLPFPTAFTEYSCCQICNVNSDPSFHRFSSRIRRMGGTHILCSISWSCGSSSMGNPRGNMGPL